MQGLQGLAGLLLRNTVYPACAPYIIGWSDIALLDDFIKWALCCRSGIFVLVQYLKMIFLFTDSFILFQRTIAKKKIWNTVWFIFLGPQSGEKNLFAHGEDKTY